MSFCDKVTGAQRTTVRTRGGGSCLHAWGEAAGAGSPAHAADPDPQPPGRDSELVARAACRGGDAGAPGTEGKRQVEVDGCDLELLASEEGAIGSNLTPRHLWAYMSPGVLGPFLGGLGSLKSRVRVPRASPGVRILTSI